jgi:hypothetical protein
MGLQGVQRSEGRRVADEEKLLRSKTFLFSLLNSRILSCETKWFFFWEKEELFILSERLYRKAYSSGFQKFLVPYGSLQQTMAWLHTSNSQEFILIRDSFVIWKLFSIWKWKNTPKSEESKFLIKSKHETVEGSDRDNGFQERSSESSKSAANLDDMSQS